MSIMTSPALRFPKSIWSYNPIPGGCVLYLPLWHPSLRGPVFKSIDPYGHTCTPAGTAVFSDANGWYLTGDDEYIDLGINTTLKPTTGLTYMAWVYHDVTYNIAAHAAVIGEGRGDNYLFVRTNGVVEMTNTDTNSQAFISASLAPITAKTWTHLTGTFADAGGGNGTNAVYINAGTPVTDTEAFDGTLNHDDPPDLGRRIFIGGENFFKGYIGEVWIYNRALSATEITYIYNKTKFRYA